MSLNEGQAKALVAAQVWHLSPRKGFLLSGAGGTGKSHLAIELLAKLKASPMILAPTNEALNQIRDKVGGDYAYRTVDSSLGIVPTTNTKEMAFEHVAIPSFWENHNLIVVDEIGSVGEDKMRLLESIGLPLFGMGDDKQLPPIVKNKANSDPCISPAFNRGYKEVILTEPMRNTGEIWEYANLVRARIDDQGIKLPRDFNISNKGFRLATSCPDALNAFQEGQAVIVAWRNSAVDRLNQTIRTKLFGALAEKRRFLPKDKIVFTKPVSLVVDMPALNGKQLIARVGGKDAGSIYSNAKATVLSCSDRVIPVAQGFHIPCHELLIDLQGVTELTYVAKDPEHIELLSTHYAHLAWAEKMPRNRARKYAERHKLLSCFAEVKHFYSSTAHRIQGASIDSVIVLQQDILDNPCTVEALKCNYVAVSRSINKLQIYNGVG